MNGVFSRKSLLRIIEENVDLDHIRNNSKSIYATTCKCINLDVKYFKVNEKEESDIKKILLASSALPFIFEQQEVNGKRYYDGGLRDNVPVKPLYDEGIRNFIVVHLSRDSMIDKTKFSDAKFIEIIPKESQGNLFSGTLDFSREGTNRRIKQGYNDTKEMLQYIYDMCNIQMKINNCLDKLQYDNYYFESENRRVQNDLKNNKDILDAMLDNM